MIQSNWICALLYNKHDIIIEKDKKIVRCVCVGHWVNWYYVESSQLLLLLMTLQSYTYHVHNHSPATPHTFISQNGCDEWWRIKRPPGFCSLILEFQIFAKSLKKIPYRRAAQLCFILGWNGLKPILHSISTGEKEIGFPSVFFF